MPIATSETKISDINLEKLPNQWTSKISVCISNNCNANCYSAIVIIIIIIITNDHFILSQSMYNVLYYSQDQVLTCKQNQIK